jgi:endonuclease/exonuclease/phosphatase (EEP) superfamily protein YafD
MPFLPRWRARLTRYFARRARVTPVLIAVCAALGWTGDWHWFPELFSHFFLQYLLLLFPITLLLFWSHAGHWRWAALAALILAGHAVAPLWLPAPARPALLADRLPVTFVQFNAAQRTEAFTHWLTRHRKSVDVVLVLEADPAFSSTMTALAEDFPHHVERLDDSPFSIALLSRYPLSAAETLEIAGADFPALKADVMTPGGPLRVIGVHPPPPLGEELSASRNRFIRKLAEIVRQYPMPTLVFGDFNAAVWSPHLRVFMAETGLTDAQNGHGAVGTWPAWSARRSGFLGIPIDAMLISPEIRILERHALPSQGSDHLPVLTRIVR